VNVFKLTTDTGPAEQYDGNDVHCCLLIASDEERKVFAEHFRSVPMSLATWKPIKVIRMDSERENLTKPLGDRAGIDARHDPPVFSRRALDVLLPYIGRFGQVLPLDFDEWEYSLFNITNVVDALDVQKSELAYFKDGGFKRVLRFAFNPEAVRDQWIFKIPQHPRMFAFVTDRFVDLVKQHGLSGFGFERLWGDEPSAAKAA
jgi:hypothetical protein